MIPYRGALGERSRERLAEVTFHLDEASGTIRGMVDGHEAARQAAWLILHTERFLHVIYSFDYGTELLGLHGKGDSFLFPEIRRRVTEALLVDERLTGTSDFHFHRRRTRLEVRFMLHTVYGETEMELEV